MSRNITLTLDEDVVERAERIAAQRHTSVDALVHDYLSSLAEPTARSAEARKRLLELARGTDSLVRAKHELREIGDTTLVDMGANRRISREDAYDARVLSGHERSGLRRDREAGRTDEMDGRPRTSGEK